MQTFEKIEYNEITVDGRALAGCECARTYEENPYLWAFKVLIHVDNVETALSYYDSFHRFLDRLPDGAKFTDGEIQEWLQWQKMGMRIMKSEQETERAVLVAGLPSLEFRFPVAV